MGPGRRLGRTATAATLRPEDSHRFALHPVAKRGPWIVSGFVLQAIGVAAPAVYVVLKAKQENLGGSLTLATIRLSWHDSVHSKTGLAVLIAGAVVFAIGAVLLARPFAKNWLIWLIAVPAAAIVGVMLLGAAALLVAVILICASSDTDFPSFSTGGGTRTRKRARH